MRAALWAAVRGVDLGTWVATVAAVSVVAVSTWGTLSTVPVVGVGVFVGVALVNLAVGAWRFGWGVRVRYSPRHGAVS